MPTTQAHRVMKARRLIAEAYGLDAQVVCDRLLRVELLGESVAVARVRGEDGVIPGVWVAQRQSPNRVVRLLRENREQFASVRAMLTYLEELYARHGGPGGEPPAPPRDQTAKGGLRLLR